MEGISIRIIAPVVAWASLVTGCSTVQQDRPLESPSPTYASAPSSPDEESSSEPTQPASHDADVRQYEQLGVIPGEYDVLEIRGRTLLATYGRIWRTFDLNGDPVAEDQVMSDDFGRAQVALVADTEDESVLVGQHELLPARGIKPAHCERTLVAFDRNLSERWRVELPAIETDSCEDPSLRVTNNGLFVAMPTLGLWLDVRAQEVHKVSGTPFPVGDLIALFDGDCGTCLSGLSRLTVVEPADDRRFVVRDTGSDEVVLTSRDPIDRYKDMLDPESHDWLDSDIAAMHDDESIYEFDSRRGRYVNKFEYASERSISSILRVDPVTRVVFIDQNPDVRAYSLANGKMLWRQKEADLCAAGNGKVVVLVNGQVATLDAETGEQLSYSDRVSSCYGTVIGEYLYGRDGTITRILA
jgi:hypothetical protein